MAIDNYLNPFFNKFDYAPTQELYQDLIVQSIQIYGHEIYYIPRNITNFDKIYETDDQSTYTNAIQCPVYIENVDGFQGQKDIFTKFGLEIRDQITLTMARRTYERVLKPITNQPRPMEGDLIYFTLNKKTFQIKYTNNKEIFYPLGILPTYQMTLELFEYSDETFDTGIPEIDAIQKDSSLNILDYLITTEDGLIITDNNGNRITTDDYSEQNIDTITDDQELASENITLVDNTETNNFGWE